MAIFAPVAPAISPPETNWVWNARNSQSGVRRFAKTCTLQGPLYSRLITANAVMNSRLDQVTSTVRGNVSIAPPCPDGTPGEAGFLESRLLKTGWGIRTGGRIIGDRCGPIAQEQFSIHIKISWDPKITVANIT